jgi:hypothetical protein
MKSRLGVRTSLDARAHDGAMDGWRARASFAASRDAANGDGERRRCVAGDSRRGTRERANARTNERTNDSIPFHSIRLIGFGKRCSRVLASERREDARAAREARSGRW